MKTQVNELQNPPTPNSDKSQVLLLPRVDELLNRLSTLSPTASSMAKLRDLFGGPDQATVAVCVVAIGMVVLVLLRLSIPSPRPRRIISALRVPFARLPVRWRWPKRNFGYATKHDVVVTRRDSGETHDSDDEP